jgi:hypothetical protein
VVSGHRLWTPSTSWYTWLNAWRRPGGETKRFCGRKYLPALFVSGRYIATRTDCKSQSVPWWRGERWFCKRLFTRHWNTWRGW